LKIIEIEKIKTLDDIDNDGTNWKRDTAFYILTTIANLSSGCIVAEWSRTTNNAVWFYSTEPCFSLKPENFEGGILIQEDISCFRMLLAALGFESVGQTYLGAGTFKVRFKNEYEESKLLAIIFSNEQGLGYWIKLQVIENFETSY
jgi:hypothetical protein